ncbi:hypothetical protein PCANC_07797 [Puccinia coronata f. sp. avenae]|uniref:Uncharacterized protein n=1 Tax=Puccinia coronata f. sp. avenae TaxID=200324 RepID=A0A2N5VBX8_9BASI|nr:hypothetical protein PCANC_07797 [Puccinia coronata f. sp. avenae]
MASTRFLVLPSYGGGRAVSTKKQAEAKVLQALKNKYEEAIQCMAAIIQEAEELLGDELSLAQSKSIFLEIKPEAILIPNIQIPTKRNTSFATPSSSKPPANKKPKNSHKSVAWIDHLSAAEIISKDRPDSNLDGPACPTPRSHATAPHPIGVDGSNNRGL